MKPKNTHSENRVVEETPIVSNCCGTSDMIPPTSEEEIESAGSNWRAFACYICRKCGKACEAVPTLISDGVKPIEGTPAIETDIVEGANDGYRYCACGCKLAFMTGSVYLTPDSEPYKSGEEIDLDIEAEPYCFAYYCEDCDTVTDIGLERSDLPIESQLKAQNEELRKALEIIKASVSGYTSLSASKISDIESIASEALNKHLKQ